MDKFLHGYTDNALKTYRIFHPYFGDLNTNCERGTYMYDHVGSVSATSLDDAFLSAQNEFDSWAEYGNRSTCVGDIIEVDGIYHMVGRNGFIEVPSTVVGYIDWGIVDNLSYRRYEDYEDMIYRRDDQ